MTKISNVRVLALKPPPKKTLVIRKVKKKKKLSIKLK